jgi:hypothetical protein
MDFAELKNQSPNTIDKMFKEIERVEAYSNRDWKKSDRWGGKIKTAITGQSEFLHMAKCRGGKNACGSVFCPKCKKSKVAGFHRDVLNYYESEFSSDERTARKQLRYGTVLHELVPVNVDNLFNEDGVIRDLIVSVARLKENLQRVEKVLLNGKPSRQVFAIGTIHLELIDVDMFRIPMTGSETDKQRTLRKWFDKFGLEKDFYFLVHTHFVIDNKRLSKQQLDDAFRSIPEWNVTSEQVWIQKFSERFRGNNLSLEKSFKNISRYAYSGSNSRLRFNTAWGNTDTEYKQKEKRDGMYRLKVYAEKTGRPNIGEDLTVGHIRLLIKAHNTFTDDGIDELRIGMGSGVDLSNKDY